MHSDMNQNRTSHRSHKPIWRWPLAYLLMALIFLAMDAVWLSLMHTRLYRPALGHLLADGIDWTAAILFYLLYIFGVVYFAIRPALSYGKPLVALGRGALLGLLAYATYDLTNQATMRDWPWHVTLADLAWGTTATGLAAWAAAALTRATYRRERRASAP